MNRRAAALGFDPRAPLPDAPVIEAAIRGVSPARQAAFLRLACDTTRWRPLPQLRAAVRGVFPQPAPAATVAEARRSIHLAHLLYYHGRPSAARRNLEAAAGPRLPARDAGTLAWIEAKIALARKDPTAAYRAFRRAERMLGDDHPLERGRFCGTFGLFYRQVGESEKARWWLERGIAYLRSAGDLYSLAMLHGNAGHLARETGRYAEALVHFTQDRRICLRIGNPFGVMLNHVRIAEVLRRLGREEAAARSYRAAIRLGRRHPEQSVVGRALLGLARLEADRGRVGAARAWLARARARLRRPPRGLARLAFLLAEADVARTAGDLDLARRRLRAALALARPYRDVFATAEVLHDLGRTEIEAGRPEAGRRALLEALRLSDRANHLEMIVRCERALAERFPADLAAARLGRFLGRRKAERILAPGAPTFFGGRRAVRTILAGNLRGFSRLCERLSAARVTRILNLYFDAVAGVVEAMGGHVDKFMGDGFLAVFPGTPRGAAQALLAARVVRREAAEIERMRPRDLAGERLHGAGIGVALGPVIEGEVGSARRFDWTVIGDAVNVASRLQHLAGPGEVLATATVARALPVPARARTPIEPVGLRRLRGRARPVAVYRLRPADGTGR